MNWALCWKDYRIFRDVFAGGLILIAACYAFAALALLMNGELTWAMWLGGGASLVRFTAVLVAALLGGYAFAGEREECSHLFMETLPVRRREQLTSKLLLAVAALGLYWGVSLLILVLAMISMGVSAAGIWLSMRALLDFVVLGLVAFAVAWRVSVGSSAPLTAALAGLGSLFPLCIAQFLATRFLGLDPLYFLSGGGLLASGLAACLLIADGGRRFVRGAADARSPGRLRPETGHGASRLMGRRVSPFIALFWKDIHLVKTVLWIGGGLALLPHGWTAAQLINGDVGGGLGPSLLSLALCAVIFPLWSSQLTGSEKRTGSVFFLGVLPIAPFHARLSKLVLLLGFPLALTALNILLLTRANNLMDDRPLLGVDMARESWYRAPELLTGLALACGATLACGVGGYLSARSGRVVMGLLVGAISGPVVVTLWAGLSTLCAQASTGAPSPLEFVVLFILAALLISVLFSWRGCAASDCIQSG